LSFFLEANRFAPVTPGRNFLCFAGDAILEELRAPAPRLWADLCGFAAEMDRNGPWVPVPLRTASTEPGGPMEHGFFAEFLHDIERGLRESLPLDAAYLSCHGAALTTESDDPDGDLYALVRRTVGPDVRLVAVNDLHANVSRRMTDSLDALVVYRTNPHDDIYERGVEAAQHLRILLAGSARGTVAMAKLPIVAPQTAQLTASGPVGDLIRFGQTKVGGAIMNVSIASGFAYSDCAKNGLTVTVSTRGDRTEAAALAREIAGNAWAMRARFKVTMTALADATAIAVRVARDPSQAPVCLADVADNPGGGGGGNTTTLLRALVAAGATGVVLGPFTDPALAAEAHALGVGARFRARFNRAASGPFADPFESGATVLTATDGRIVSTRGVLRGMALDMGPCCALDLGGVVVAVISHRMQALDPLQFTSLGLDVGAARTVVVKSRGHFRSGFRDLFAPEQIYEVDCPGLTSPNLAQFTWRGLPRPVYPLDEDAVWADAGDAAG
jgi:microcystin degradation protein MlrC